MVIKNLIFCKLKVEKSKKKKARRFSIKWKNKLKFNYAKKL